MKALRMLLIAVLGALFLAVATTAAGAETSPTPRPTKTHTDCNYPIGGKLATLTVSTTTPFAGEVITVAGSNFEANTAYEVIFASNPVVLAHVTTDAGGSFSVHVTIPANATGSHEIVTEGVRFDNTCPTQHLSIPITMQTSPGAPHGGGLAFTGVDILGMIALALLLIAAGVFFSRSGRRASAHGGSRHR